MTAVKFYGRNFIIVNAGSVTFVYCVEENAWHEWNTASGVRLWYKCAGVSSGSTQPVYALTNTTTGGKVYTINPSSMTFQDDGNAFTMRIQTSKVGGIKRTFWDEAGLICDQQTSSSPTQISYSDDDYQTYILLCTVDQMDSRPRINRCGSSYRRAWVVTNSANTPSRIEALAGVNHVGLI